MAKRRRVLIMRLTAMGDVAMTAPIVSAACEANPEVDFHYLTTPFFSPFFEKRQNLTIIGTNIRKEKSGIMGLWRLYRKLQAQGGYDTVIDLHDVLRTKALRTMMRLSGSHVSTIDKGRKEKKALTANGRSKRLEQLKKTTERYADTFLRAGISIVPGRQTRRREPLPHLCPTDSKQGETWIGISPFAQHRGKMYPIEKMGKVIGLLQDVNEATRIFIFGGGEKEKELAESLINGRDRCHNMIGVMPLHDEMALMSNLDCMVSMDSSAMHVCSLYGVRVVSIWGATHPYAGFLGYGQSEADVVQRTDLTCRPCSVYGNKKCAFDDYRCFDIEPKDIAEKVMSGIQQL